MAGMVKFCAAHAAREEEKLRGAHADAVVRRSWRDERRAESFKAVAEAEETIAGDWWYVGEAQAWGMEQESKESKGRVNCAAC